MSHATRAPLLAALIAFAIAGPSGCGSSRPPPTAPEEKAAQPPAGGDEEVAPATCEDACTEYAVCYEEVNESDFRGGGDCVSSCDELTEEARAAYFACIAGAGDCAKMVGC